MTSVFWANLDENERDELLEEYEGCRGGINGLGGAGARGYLVMWKDDTGEVGDLMVATVRGGSDSFEVGDASPLEALRCDLLLFRFRAVSSLYSLMRIERLTGVASSDEDDNCDLIFSSAPESFSSRVSRASNSDSDTTNERESAAGDLLDLALVPLLWRLPFAVSVGSVDLWSKLGEAERPMAWAVDLLPPRPDNTRPKLRTGRRGENIPFSL